MTYCSSLVIIWYQTCDWKGCGFWFWPCVLLSIALASHSHLSHRDV